jgi:hypothetical protein
MVNTNAPTSPQTLPLRSPSFAGDYVFRYRGDVHNSQAHSALILHFTLLVTIVDREIDASRR